MRKILLIEDNRDIRENTGELLTLAGYDVVTAENGKVGVDVAIREHPDLIICDIMMPELDGYGVLHILAKRRDTEAIPFIFLTALAEKSEVRKGMELGADDYLTKPFDETDLLNAVEARLKKSSLRTKEYTPASDFSAFLSDAGKILNLKNLAEGKSPSHIKKKTVLFSEGDSPASVYLVQSGEIKVSRLHQDGKELITNLYTANDFFGFEAVLENSPYNESAVAMQDSTVVAIPKEDFMALLYGHPDVSAAFISMLCKKVVEKETALLNLAYSSVRQRTAMALLKAMEVKGENSLINIAREDLARIVGTAPESVIRVLSDFKDEGLITIETGKIRIVKPDKLEKVVRWNVAR